jgi:hypothetical protein
MEPAGVHQRVRVRRAVPPVLQQIRPVPHGQGRAWGHRHRVQGPLLFAIKWADAFFDRFLYGTPVGETVLELRRDFVGDHGNPLGLIYAVHCDADTQIAPALARAKAG